MKRKMNERFRERNEAIAKYFYEHEGVSMAEIGRRYGLSRERIRQILDNLETQKRSNSKSLRNRS